MVGVVVILCRAAFDRADEDTRPYMSWKDSRKIPRSAGEGAALQNDNSPNDDDGLRMTMRGDVVRLQS